MTIVGGTLLAGFAFAAVAHRLDATGGLLRGGERFSASTGLQRDLAGRRLRRCFAESAKRPAHALRSAGIEGKLRHLTVFPNHQRDSGLLG